MTYIAPITPELNQIFRAFRSLQAGFTQLTGFGKNQLELLTKEQKNLNDIPKSLKLSKLQLKLAGLIRDDEIMDPNCNSELISRETTREISSFQDETSKNGSRIQLAIIFFILLSAIKVWITAFAEPEVAWLLGDFALILGSYRMAFEGFSGLFLFWIISLGIVNYLINEKWFQVKFNIKRVPWFSAWLDLVQNRKTNQLEFFTDK